MITFNHCITFNCINVPNYLTNERNSSKGSLLPQKNIVKVQMKLVSQKSKNIAYY